MTSQWCGCHLGWRQRRAEALWGMGHQQNLILNVEKTKELMIQFRRTRHTPLQDTAAEISTYLVSGVHIADYITWKWHTSAVKRCSTQRSSPPSTEASLRACKAAVPKTERHWRRWWGQLTDHWGSRCQPSRSCQNNAAWRGQHNHQGNAISSFQAEDTAACLSEQWGSMTVSTTIKRLKY